MSGSNVISKTPSAKSCERGSVARGFTGLPAAVGSLGASGISRPNFSKSANRCLIFSPARPPAIRRDLQQHILIRRPALNLHRRLDHLRGQGRLLGGRLGLLELLAVQIAGCLEDVRKKNSRNHARNRSTASFQGLSYSLSRELLTAEPTRRRPSWCQLQTLYPAKANSSSCLPGVQAARSIQSSSTPFAAVLVAERAAFFGSFSNY